jgi:citrate synthase
MSSETAKLEVRGQSIDLPVVEGTEGEVAVHIGKLRAETGAITLDEGYANTGACESGITFLDGEKGILRYRGYPIEDLAEHASFLEVAYLLIFGELPTKEQVEGFETALTRHTLLHEDMRRFFDAFPPDAHPMAILSSVVCGLSTFYEDSHNTFDPEAVHITLHRLVAKLPTIAAFSYRKSRGLPLMYPDNSLYYTANFLRMMFGFPTEPYEVDEEIVRALDVLFILHADHEQNCSTSTVRMVGSAQANLFASVSAGICALWGPLHGGANQRVLEMLAHIQDSGGDVKRAVAQAKDKKSGFRLFGFGHRVYKSFDPRAKIIKRHADKVLGKLGVADPLLDIAKELEQVALEDEYFIERKLYPNVDFYSGIIYRALGFPVTMFTVLFALGRLPGWIAQWKEMMESSSRIGRPRQIYTGETLRDYVPIEKRG